MAGKQAKVLSTAQVGAVLAYLSTTRHPLRDRVMFLLSVKAGLRAMEIALLTWSMVTDSSGQVGDVIHLEDRAAKRQSGRCIPLNRDLHAALRDLHAFRSPAADQRIVYSERGAALSANVVAQWFLRIYRQLGFEGCSSHSGRRTFVTLAARKIAMVGGSLRDVQVLAGHRSLAMTSAYIEGDCDAQRKIVNLI